MSVTETFFTLEVRDMERAKAFYVAALDGTVSFVSTGWSSVHVAGVRIGLFASSESVGGGTGLHFAVENLGETLAAIEKAGGKTVMKPTDAGQGVVLAKAQDTEGNVFTLRGP